MTGIKLTAERLRTLLHGCFREACGAARVTLLPAWNPAADLAGFRHLFIRGNLWVSSLGLPVLDLRRMLLLLLL